MILLRENFRYFAIYSVASIGLLSWSLYRSLTKAINLITFIVEFTDGYHLRILLNAIVFSFMACNLLIHKLLFGELRLIEHEHLTRVLPLYSMNLLLNLAVNDGNAIFNCLLLGMCISSKIYHILLMDRLDQVHVQLLNNYGRRNYSKKDVLRKFLGSLYFVSTLVFITGNFIIAKFLVYEVFQGINSIACVLYGFQFAVVAVDTSGYLLKLLTGIYEIVMYMIESGDRDWSTVATSSDSSLPYDVMPDEGDDDDEDGSDRIWEAKPFYTKGIDIAISTLKALLHLWFIYILTFRSGLALPISMLQGTYSSVKQVYTEITQLLVFIESSKRMDTQLRNATQQDLDATDVLCIICREDMCCAAQYLELHQKPLPPRKTPKKLWCNHILHLGCLKEWLERSDSCPLCRNKVFERPATTPPQPTGLAPQETNNAEQVEAAPLPREVDPRVNEFNQFLNPHPVEEVAEQLEPRQDAEDQESHGPDLDADSTSNPTPTSTQDEEGRYQNITLPRLALLPPDWILLPLERLEGDSGIEPGPRTQYLVCISETMRANISVKLRPQNRIVEFSRPESL